MLFGDRRSHIPDKQLTRLQLNGHYPCPVCRNSQLESLFMVEALACPFCRHIFTVNELTQVLRMEDRGPSLQWRWSGDRWLTTQKMSQQWMLGIWLLSLSFVGLPTLLVWLSYHLFPPLPSQSGVAFSLFWLMLTLLSHLSIAGWLLLEYYQFPFYVGLKFNWSRLCDRLASG